MPSHLASLDLQTHTHTQEIHKFPAEKTHSKRRFQVDFITYEIPHPTFACFHRITFFGESRPFQFHHNQRNISSHRCWHHLAHHQITATISLPLKPSLRIAQNITQRHHPTSSPNIITQHHHPTSSPNITTKHHHPTSSPNIITKHHHPSPITHHPSPMTHLLHHHHHHRHHHHHYHHDHHH